MPIKAVSSVYDSRAAFLESSVPLHCKSTRTPAHDLQKTRLVKVAVRIFGLQQHASWSWAAVRNLGAVNVKW